MLNRIAQYDRLGQATIRADKLLQQHSFDTAVDLWNDFLESNPDCAEAYFERGRAKALQATDAKGMLSDYQKATELKPNHAGFRYAFHLTLGGALQGAFLDGAPLEVVEQAIDHFDIAVECSPKSGEAMTYRGTAFLQLGEATRALEDFDMAIALDYGNALARLMRGSIYLDHEELASAKIDFEVAMACRDKLDDGYAELLDEWYSDLSNALAG